MMAPGEVGITLEAYDNGMLAAEPDSEKLPTPLRVFGILAIVAGGLGLPLIGFLVIAGIYAIQAGYLSNYSAATIAIFYVHMALTAVVIAALVVVGIRLLRNKRRGAALAVYVIIGVTVVDFLVNAMLYGLGKQDILFAIVLAVLVTLSSYIDPSLAEERAVQRELQKMENRSDAEAGTLGRDKTGKGYITLNFFNIFWIFIVCCILGLLIEVIFHAVVFGGYQDRAGMLFGPFSPIYGFGGILMTMALNRFHKSPIIVIFLVSALIGGAFEYFTSWFMQFAFGITAWDYTGTWLSIGGRTNGMFMIMWGIAGLIWIKAFLPQMLKLVNLIPWNWRYTVTTICAVLVLIDGMMTLQSLDCWYQREAGQTPTTQLEVFYSEHFDDDYMANRFQSMSIDPSNATRVA
jgi:uncharacterized membrane protein